MAGVCQPACWQITVPPGLPYLANRSGNRLREGIATLVCEQGFQPQTPPLWRTSRCDVVPSTPFRMRIVGFIIKALR
ncbi:hypothetical protein ARMA_0227 [Ardenticatena maritima]|uniref:Uncharacterized protein n=1 Tax=Ardenticatena maritima TaxID=872965 RepID=A0A0M9UBF9_9CHLR|nr:hypothetical protein ARMA_0227 [Ardenticatena maritima]